MQTGFLLFPQLAFRERSGVGARKLFTFITIHRVGLYFRENSLLKFLFFVGTIWVLKFEKGTKKQSIKQHGAKTKCRIYAVFNMNEHCSKRMATGSIPPTSIVGILDGRVEDVDLLDL